MNKAIVTIGALGLFVGFFIAIISYPTVQDYETTAGQIVRAINDEAQEDYENAVLMMWGGSCFGVIGLILLIIGAAMKSKKSTTAIQHAYHHPQHPPAHYPRPQHPPTFCPNCREAVEAKWNACPNCTINLR